MFHADNFARPRNKHRFKPLHRREAHAEYVVENFPRPHPELMSVWERVFLELHYGKVYSLRAMPKGWDFIILAKRANILERILLRNPVGDGNNRVLRETVQGGDYARFINDEACAVGLILALFIYDYGKN